MSFLLATVSLVALVVAAVLFGVACARVNFARTELDKQKQAVADVERRRAFERDHALEIDLMKKLDDYKKRSTP